MTNNKYKWLLFDADDTLFDYAAGEVYALGKTFETFGSSLDQQKLSVYREENKKVWTELELGLIDPDKLKYKRFESTFQKLGLNYNPLEFSKQYLYNLGESAYLIENALEVVTALQEKYNLAIVTNGLKDVQHRRLMNSSIANFIAHIFTSEELNYSKPQKEYFDKVFEGLDNPSKETVLVIGDNLNSDIKGGIDYGIDTCWYNPAKISLPENFKTTFTITDLTQLYNFL